MPKVLRPPGCRIPCRGNDFADGPAGSALPCRPRPGRTPARAVHIVGGPQPEEEIPMIVRRAWITGAGRGIGRESALRFARAGWELFLSSRTETELAGVADLCRRDGAKATVLPLDVRSPESVEKAAGEIERSGGLGVLVASAGVASFRPVAETSYEEWERLLAVNLTGAFLCIRSVIPGMTRRGGGKILLLSSIAARVPLRGAGAYAASKAGLSALAAVAREELRGTGVRVTLVVPGAVDSPLWDSVGSDLDRRRMIPARLVAEALLRVAEEPPEATTEEIVLLPPDGIL